MGEVRLASADHILPRFGDLVLGEVTRMAVKAWVKSLRRSLAEPTVIDVVLLLSMVLGEAVEEGMIGANRCRRLRLRLRLDGRSERPHARPEQITELVRRVRPVDGVLIITAAYTGIRWGELGLRSGPFTFRRFWSNSSPHTATRIPTAGSCSPPPMVDFTGGRTSGDASGFPAVDGDVARGWAPVAPGLHVHDLRHTHKTWLIEDQVPEVLQSKRLGHELGGVRGGLLARDPTDDRRSPTTVGAAWEHRSG